MIKNPYKIAIINAKEHKNILIQWKVIQTQHSVLKNLLLKKKKYFTLKQNCFFRLVQIRLLFMD